MLINEATSCLRDDVVENVATGTREGRAMKKLYRSAANLRFVLDVKEFYIAYVSFAASD